MLVRSFKDLVRLTFVIKVRAALFVTLASSPSDPFSSTKIIGGRATSTTTRMDLSIPFLDQDRRQFKASGSIGHDEKHGFDT